MSKVGSDRVDFDVLRWSLARPLRLCLLRTIVDIDELFVDEGSNGPRMVEIWIVLARLVSDLILAPIPVVTNLSKQPSTPTTTVVDEYIMVLSIYWLLHKWLLDHNAIHDNSVPIRS
jgi:hypothetical protein